VLLGLVLSFVGIAAAVGMATAYKVAALRRCRSETVLAVERAVLLVVTSPLVVWLGDAEVRFGAVALGIASGVSLVFGRRCYLRALEVGSASLSWFVLTASQVVPVTAAVLVFGERPKPWQSAGIALALPALFALGRGREGAAVEFRRWVPLIALAGCLEALFGVLFLLVRELGFQTSRNMYLLSYNAAALTVALALRHRGGPQRPAAFELRIGTLSGLAMSAGALSSMYALFCLPAHIYFPLVTSAVVVLFTIVSVVAWRERLERRQWAGLSLGVVAIVLVCLE
jgi:drug/metabolite transporter (DMT)-like permease